MAYAKRILRLPALPDVASNVGHQPPPPPTSAVARAALIEDPGSPLGHGASRRDVTQSLRGVPPPKRSANWPMPKLVTLLGAVQWHQALAVARQPREWSTSGPAQNREPGYPPALRRPCKGSSVVRREKSTPAPSVKRPHRGRPGCRARAGSGAAPTRRHAPMKPPN
eukprot:2109953-Prymnesium_polylepis.1